MMKTNCKAIRIIGSILFIVLLFSMFTVSVAANTEDAPWSVSWTSSETDFKYLGASRPKGNSTPVFVRVDTSSQSASYVDVKVLGTNQNPVTGWPQLYNMTYYGGAYKNYARCYLGTNYKISSRVYEAGYSYATLAFKSQKRPDACTGWWSADTASTAHSIPTYY